MFVESVRDDLYRRRETLSILAARHGDRGVSGEIERRGERSLIDRTGHELLIRQTPGGQRRGGRRSGGRQENVVPREYVVELAREDYALIDRLCEGRVEVLL